jgi:hypothetical protein
VFQVQLDVKRSRKFPVTVPLLNLRPLLGVTDTEELAERVSKAVQVGMRLVQLQCCEQHGSCCAAHMHTRVWTHPMGGRSHAMATDAWLPCLLLLLLLLRLLLLSLKRADYVVWLLLCRIKLASSSCGASAHGSSCHQQQASAAAGLTGPLCVPACALMLWCRTWCASCSKQAGRH